MWARLNRSSSSSARASICCSWARHRGAHIDDSSRSPRCPVAPSFMFSITLSRVSALVSWKVRTIPSRATSCAATLRRLWPSKVPDPVSATSNPVIRLKKVVLPAPLGPISEVMTPRWISRWSTSTAISPPNARRTWSTTRIGSGLGTPGSGATSASAAAPGDGSAIGISWSAPDRRESRSPNGRCPHDLDRTAVWPDACGTAAHGRRRLGAPVGS